MIVSVRLELRAAQILTFFFKLTLFLLFSFIDSSCCQIFTLRIYQVDLIDSQYKYCCCFAEQSYVHASSAKLNVLSMINVS